MSPGKFLDQMTTILGLRRGLPPSVSSPDEQARIFRGDAPSSGSAGGPSGNYSARRINWIAKHINARSYLEIGVSRGVTFRKVKIEKKVAVDPRFRFDVAELRGTGCEFHEMPSDRYFLKAACVPKFDVIFLDGLHQFQQTFRDFCNSLACAHDGTVWLIDDVIPCDVYSAWPVQRESIEFRQRGGVERAPAWHGDVYKLVFVLHDFFPMLSYVTLVGTGNPQTIIWRAPRAEFSPLFDRLEVIERLAYFEMLKRYAVFNAKSEEEAFSAFLESRSNHRSP